MLPVIDAFKAAHQLSDVTVVADAGMISEANQVALQAAGLSFILGTRIPFLPDVVREWRDEHPDQAVPDQLVLTQPWPATSSDKARGIPDRVVYYQFRHDQARGTLRGIAEQITKAQRAVDGHAPVKRNRLIKLTGATKTVNRELEAKNRALAGWKGYTTNLTTATAVGIGVAVGKGASAGAMRKPTASNAAPTKSAARFTALDLPPGCDLGPIGANFMSGY
jgi:hypothetical protein